MAHKNHKEVEVQSTLKVVISLLTRKFSGVVDITSALAAIDYAGKETLRLAESITGIGTVLGNVMVLDLNIPLHSSYSGDVSRHYDEFNRKVADYLMNGKTHVTSGNRLGGFGRLNVGYVSPTPSNDRKVTVVLETERSDWAVKDALKNVGTVVEVR
jgi:hypothetical protein